MLAGAYWLPENNGSRSLMATGEFEGVRPLNNDYIQQKQAAGLLLLRYQDSNLN